MKRLDILTRSDELTKW